MSEPTGRPPAPDHRGLAVALFNTTWELLGRDARTPEQDDELVHGVHASCWHWSRVGTVVEAARGEWLCAHVYSVLGRAEPAIHHAERALQLVEQGDPGFADWDLASAPQAVGGAHHVAGDTDAAQDFAARTRAALADVADPEDADLVRSQLHEWAG